MGPILSAIFGGPIGKTIETVVDRVVIDKNLGERLKAELERDLAKAATEANLAQLEVNKAEAANPSLFVSGWRPGVGWVCVAALAYQFVLSPVAMWGATWAGYNMPMPPQLDDMLWQLIFGMLGMGALRSFEKSKGVASK